jgi:hypothetical protein
MGKTGSSALQVALVRNRELLAERGIRYPAHVTDERALRGETVSGNGLALAPYLAPQDKTTDDEGTAALASLLSEVDTASARSLLYSSEMLFYFDVERLRALHQTLAARGVRLRVMMFVRDIAGHALSSYAQEVKRSMYADPLRTYLEGYCLWPADMSMGPRLRAAVEIIGVENTVVAHYDTERRHLVQAFLSAVFGIDELTGFEIDPGKVNRSLTARETEWMRHLNSRLNTLLGALIASDVIISREPVDGGRMAVTEAEALALEGRFGDEVSWINETFFTDGRLSITGRTPVVDDALEVPTTTEVDLFLLDCIAELANEQQHGRDVRTARARARAARAAEQSATTRARIRRRLGTARRKMRGRISGQR